jgi:hypothetical protein
MGMAAAAKPKRKKGFKKERLMGYKEILNVKLFARGRSFPERKFHSYCAPSPAYEAGLAGHVPAKVQMGF